MSDTYQIYTPNSIPLQVDKGTNKIHFTDGGYKTGKYTEAYSKALIKAWQIMEEAKKKYKPNYLDPNYYTGQKSHLSEFKAIQKLYYKDPIKGAIAPWTKAEKAYYESLKTKRERYQYLVIRSGLRSAVIDIPFDAIGGVDDNGNVINPAYEEIFYEVSRNRGTLKSIDFGNEWTLSSGLLGKRDDLSTAASGFKARIQQALFLEAQLGGKSAFRSLGTQVLCSNSMLSGLHWNKLRANMIHKLTEKHSMLLDRFGMIPYLDEIIGVDWVMDLNMLYGYSVDENGFNIERYLREMDEGKLLDPRDPKATEQTRREFRKAINKISFWRYDVDLSNERTQKSADLYIDTMLLEAKIMAVTPPQGYPNAPTYYIPEYLEELYREGKFDIKLDPTIPAMYRESFPEELRAKILAYAKKHNIKE
ncbi:hypothetical protein CQA53_10780 [Helicobacter didelphidarum]|uniref:Thioredoxin reductase n=1 Tax=Helicobacter didelphidarum TaxID=2040648 RepID=A0A3D8I609_9HELI|nr:hypothetical protein [Helicobacter didelphidarum]RDU60610.1 hypothetical protein CQA53_10780 [Helicobacter didelphidarum]